MKNPHGGKPNKEWGRKARKEEDALRGLNNSGRKETIKEALVVDDPAIDEAFNDEGSISRCRIHPELGRPLLAIPGDFS